MSTADKVAVDVAVRVERETDNLVRLSRNEISLKLPELMPGIVMKPALLMRLKTERMQRARAKISWSSQPVTWLGS